MLGSKGPNDVMLRVSSSSESLYYIRGSATTGY